MEIYFGFFWYLRLWGELPSSPSIAHFEGFSVLDVLCDSWLTFNLWSTTAFLCCFLSMFDHCVRMLYFCFFLAILTLTSCVNDYSTDKLPKNLCNCCRFMKVITKLSGFGSSCNFWAHSDFYCCRLGSGNLTTGSCSFVDLPPTYTWSQLGHFVVYHFVQVQGVSSKRISLCGEKFRNSVWCR